METGTVKWFN